MPSETTEKIVESYVRYVKGWATIPNIKCKGQYEIDLLAIDPIKGDRYHIESGVSISGGFSKLTGDSFSIEMLRERIMQASQRRTVDYFRTRKFDLPAVINKLEEYGFKKSGYHKVIVTWGWTVEAKQQADASGIILWDFRDMMSEIAGRASGDTYFGDDTLRTLQLFVKSIPKRT
jgi:hypothetical protein